jgi:hypothetical protein
MQSFSTVYGTHCGISYVAKVLRVSVGVMHGLVQSGLLHACRTEGGRRLISLSYRQEYVAELGLLISKIMINPRQSLRVVIIENDKNNQELFKVELFRWGINSVIRESGSTELLDAAIFQSQVFLINTEKIRLKFSEQAKVLKDRHGSKIQILGMLNFNSDQNVRPFSLIGMGVFRFFENRGKLKNYLLNLKKKLVA